MQILFIAEIQAHVHFLYYADSPSLGTLALDSSYRVLHKHHNQRSYEWMPSN